MKLNLEKVSEGRNALITCLYYAGVGLVVFLINVSGQFKSGMCSPNLDALSVLAIGPLSLLFFLGNMLAKLGAQKPTLYSAFIHLLVFFGWLIFLKSI